MTESIDFYFILGLRVEIQQTLKDYLTIILKVGHKLEIDCKIFAKYLRTYYDHYIHYL